MLFIAIYLSIHKTRFSPSSHSFKPPINQHLFAETNFYKRNKPASTYCQRYICWLMKNFLISPRLKKLPKSSQPAAINSSSKSNVIPKNKTSPPLCKQRSINNNPTSYPTPPPSEIPSNDVISSDTTDKPHSLTLFFTHPFAPTLLHSLFFPLFCLVTLKYKKQSDHPHIANMPHPYA